MNGVNSIHVVGVVTAPVDLRRTGTGKSVVNLTIATKARGNTSHHRAVVWGAVAEFVGAHVHRGDMVYVSGALEYREWTTESNELRVSAEINAYTCQLLDGGDRGSSGRTEAPADYETSGNR